MEYFTGRVYKVQIKDDFKNSSNMLSLKQKEYIDSIYVGSTMDSLKNRFKHHKLICNNNCNTMIFVNMFGSKNMEIVLINEYTIVDEKHLFMYETLWMYKLKKNTINLLNSQDSFCMKKYIGKHRYFMNKEAKEIKNKDYYQNNKEYFQEKSKENRLKKKDSFVCHTCNKLYSRPKELEIHLNSKLHKFKSGYIQKCLYYCKYCKLDTNDRNEFSVHIKSEIHLNNTINLSLEEKDIIFRFNYKCTECNFEADTKREYSIHVKSDTHSLVFNLDNKNECKQCNLTFKRKGDLNKHLKTKSHIEGNKIHGIYKYVCNTCPLSSNNRLNFAKHLKSEDHILNISESKEIIDFEFKYTCNKCNFHTEEKKSYTAHINSKSHKQKN